MPVDLVASFDHYREHLLPIWQRLAPGVKGRQWRLGDLPPRQPDTIAMVASYKDARSMQARNIPYVYVEHGAGQTYAGDANPAVRNHPSYSGGGGVRMEDCLGYVAPSAQVAARWRNAPAIAVGCPKMDQYDGLHPTDPEAICFTFHWQGTMCPENGTAFWHYESRLADIAEHLRTLGHRVYGHAHPRWEGMLDGYFERAGITMLATDRDVFHTANMLIADNTSLIPEFASLGRPVALLGAPEYRRNIEHGGRFWEWPKIVPEFAGADELLAWVPWLGDPRHRAASRKLARLVYDRNDGQASWRAAAFITAIALEL